MKKFNELPLYDVVIDATKEDAGMGKISFVHSPANKRPTLKFSAQEDKDIKLAFSAERRLVTAVVMQPDFPMFREVNGEKFYVQFPAETIEFMRDLYMKELKLHEVNVEHKLDVDDVFMVESWIVDSSRGIKAPDGLESNDGTWVATFRVENDKVWSAVNDGTFNGISLEGVFDLYETFSAQTEESLPDVAISPLLLSILQPQASLQGRMNAINNLNEQKK